MPALIVNVGSQCGYSPINYVHLSEIQKEFGDSKTYQFDWYWTFIERTTFLLQRFAFCCFQITNFMINR